jgi:hypothetical protein
MFALMVFALARLSHVGYAMASQLTLALLP